MLSDRSYMRSEYPRGAGTSAYVWLVCAIVAMFVLELVLLSPQLGGAAELVNQLTLTIAGMRSWHVWTLLTHSFLHSTGTPWHILFTVPGLIFIGRELEPVLGAKRFLALYAGMVVLGGLAWTAVNWSHGTLHIGAGSAVFGFLVVLACVHPQMELSFFFFPILFNIRHIVYALIAVNVLGLLLYEIHGTLLPLGMTPSAHLGGMLTGWIYFRFLHASHGMDRAAGLAWPAWLRRWPKWRTAPRPAASPSRKPSPNLRAEVDRILDKINSQGFGALTDEEKSVLDEAKDLLSRH